ncbi:MAG: hypothetical protein ACRCX2_02245 [Paraclostridium sp.]
MSNERSYFYQNWFSEERQYFSRIGVTPTHCVIKPSIYDCLIKEYLDNNYTYIREDERDKVYSEDIVYMGVKIKRGISKDIFTFYSEE